MIDMIDYNNSTSLVEQNKEVIINDSNPGIFK
jgi:hypothetical protein